MSKSSIASARQSPAADVNASGALIVHAETLTLETTERVELVDLSERLGAIVLASHVKEGLVSVWSMHTTCAVFINEVNRPARRHPAEQTVARDGSGCTTTRHWTAIAITPMLICAYRARPA